MSDEFDDLLGSSDSSDDKAPDDLKFASGGKEFARSLAVTQVDRARKGAPPEWFAKLLGIGRTTVQNKIPDSISPVHLGRGGTRYYRPSEVLPYLVQPHDIGKHLMRMNPRDLPERLRREFWAARKLEQDVRLRAGDLWLTQDVHRVLGDLMKLTKDSVRLWTDTIDGSVGLSPEQVALLDELSRKLLSDYADAVTQYVTAGATPSQEIEFEEDNGEA